MASAKTHRLTDPRGDLDRVKRSLLTGESQDGRQDQACSGARSGGWSTAFWAAAGAVTGLVMIRSPRLRRAVWPLAVRYLTKRWL